MPKSIGFEPQTCDEYSFHSARPDGNELKRQVDDKKRISMDIPASSTQGDRFLFSFICFRLHKQFNDVGVVACNFQDLFNKTFTVMLCTLGSSLTHRNAVSTMSPFSKRNQKLSTLFFLNNTRRSPVPLLMTYSPWNSHHSIEQGDKIRLVVLNVLRTVRKIGAFVPQKKIYTLIFYAGQIWITT